AAAAGRLPSAQHRGVGRVGKGLAGRGRIEGREREALLIAGRRNPPFGEIILGEPAEPDLLAVPERYLVDGERRPGGGNTAWPGGRTRRCYRSNGYGGVPPEEGRHAGGHPGRDGPHAELGPQREEKGRGRALDAPVSPGIAGSSIDHRRHGRRRQRAGRWNEGRSGAGRGCGWWARRRGWRGRGQARRRGWGLCRQARRRGRRPRTLAG